MATKIARSPFAPATNVAKKLKVLFYGPSGSGKTFAALSFPRVALVDAEGGADLYAGRSGIQPFAILRTKTVQQLREAILFMREDNGRTFDTLVVDPITVFYDVLKESTARITKNGDLGYREWARVNGQMKGLYNDLTQLPVHVVLIARESIEYEGAGGDLRKIGVKPDADKALPYLFDFVVRFNPDHSGLVVKSRGQQIGDSGVLRAVNWAAFEPASRTLADGDWIEHQSEEAAVEAVVQNELDDEDTERLTRLTSADAERLFRKWRAQGLSDAHILAALQVKQARQYLGDFATADAQVSAWLKGAYEEVASGQ